MTTDMLNIVDAIKSLIFYMPEKDPQKLYVNTLKDYVHKAEMVFEVKIGNDVILCDGLVFKDFGGGYLSLNPNPLTGDERKDWESIMLTPSLSLRIEQKSGKFSKKLIASWSSQRFNYKRSWSFVNEKDATSARDFILEISGLLNTK